MSQLSSVSSTACLTDIDELLPNVRTHGFPEDFSALFRRTELRLLRNGDDAVVVFRNKDLVECAANPYVGNTPFDCQLRRMKFIEPVPGGDGYSSVERFLRNLVFTSNPPSHASKRPVIARPLVPKQVPLLAPMAKHILKDLIERAVRRGTVDFMAEVSNRLTVKFWGAQFDMQSAEVDRLSELLNMMAPLFYFTPTREEALTADRATGEYLNLVANAVERALARRPGELLQLMKSGFDVLSRDEKAEGVGAFIAANIFNGLHTAAVGIGNAVYQLLHHQNAVAQVRATPTLVANAVAEGLRLSPPFPYTERYALQDLEIRGVALPKGTSIGMLWGAGNRDPDIYENPDCYDIFRKQRTELTFGGGVHICPGRYVARMLMHLTIEGVLAPELRVALADDHPAWLPRSPGRQLEHMAVTVERIASALFEQNSRGRPPIP